MTETDVRTALPDPATDPAGYVLAVAALRERRAKAATQGLWESLDNGDRLVAWQVGAHGFDDEFEYVVDEPVSNSANAEHIAAEGNPAHALAEVALWCSMAERHTDDSAGYAAQTGCSICGSEDVGAGWPCPDLLAVVAAAKAYAGSPA